MTDAVSLKPDLGRFGVWTFGAVKPEQAVEIEPNLAVVARLEAEMTAPNREQVQNVRFHLSGCP